MWPEGRSELILAKDFRNRHSRSYVDLPAGRQAQPEAGQGQCSSQKGYVIS